MSGYILGITRGHNGAAVLLKDGEIVFHMEEERLTRMKYDGSPTNVILKVLEYTDKLDHLVICHTQPINQAGTTDYNGEDYYSSLCRKYGLIDKPNVKRENPVPQVIDMAHIHHKLHAACAFYRSGFESATAVIIDGAGTFAPLSSPNFGYGMDGRPLNLTTYEVESIISCNYPSSFVNLFKHHGTREPNLVACVNNFKAPLDFDYEHQEEEFPLLVSDRAGIVKCYEAITEYLGFGAIEAGKTMGLFPYGEEDPALPKFFQKYNPSEGTEYLLSDRNLVAPQYPMTGWFQQHLHKGYQFSDVNDRGELTTLKNRKDAAYAVQMETQKAAAWYIRKAYEMTGNKNIVVSGGYGLNCVANYDYLDELKDLDLNIYVEPISSDAGTCIGGAMMLYHYLTVHDQPGKVNSDLYLGPKYDYTPEHIEKVCTDPAVELQTNVDAKDVVKLMTEKNIVAFFQGRSESGPRALGNRSLLFDPRFEDGKDFVNQIKRREFFRPFAGSILQDDVHEWFDLRGMEETPHMMYAVNCQEGIAEKIPSIIHVDGTCRIQTVTEERNSHYYNFINTFKEETGCPIVFNTSFNLGGEPLVETLEDAVRTLIQSEIEYLYLPEYDSLITVKNPTIS